MSQNLLHVSELVTGVQWEECHVKAVGGQIQALLFKVRADVGVLLSGTMMIISNVGDQLQYLELLCICSKNLA